MFNLLLTNAEFHSIKNDLLQKYGNRIYLKNVQKNELTYTFYPDLFKKGYWLLRFENVNEREQFLLTHFE